VSDRVFKYLYINCDKRFEEKADLQRYINNMDRIRYQIYNIIIIFLDPY
jgi:hypothetical protein